MIANFPVMLHFRWGPAMSVRPGLRSYAHQRGALVDSPDLGEPQSSHVDASATRHRAWKWPPAQRHEPDATAIARGDSPMLVLTTGGLLAQLNLKTWIETLKTEPPGAGSAGPRQNQTLGCP